MKSCFFNYLAEVDPCVWWQPLQTLRCKRILPILRGRLGLLKGSLNKMPKGAWDIGNNRMSWTCATIIFKNSVYNVFNCWSNVFVDCSVAQVRVGSFRSPHISGFFDRTPTHEALLGLVDGRGNSALAQRIALLMPSYIRKEQRTESDAVQQEYLKHAFLSVNR